MTRLFPATAFCTIFMVTPALADITVDDAWAVWKAQFHAFGLTLDASESRDGDTLKIGEIKLSVNLPNDTGSAYLSFAGPRFEPVSDGTVEVHFPKASRVSLGAEVIDEGSFAAVGELTGDDAPGIMSGDAMNVTSRWNSDGFTLTLLDVVVDGSEAFEVSGEMRLGPITLSNVTVIDDAHVTITGDSALESYDLTYRAAFKEGEETARIEGGGAGKAAANKSTLVLPRAGLDLLALHGQLRDGLRLHGDSTVGESTSFQRVFMGESTLSDQVTKAEDYVIDATFDAQGLNYGGTTGAFSLDMAMPELPFPISIAGEGVEGRLVLPLLKSDAVQKAGAKIALNGVTIDEGLWSLFDPSAQLPRDPMKIAFDLGAEAKVLFELLDIRAMMDGAEPEEMPVTMERVTLNSMTVSAVGVELTGTGDFMLDFDDMVTFDGFPAPEGEAAFMLKGANALIDRLIAMGLMSNDDAMGARMMMAMFAKPGDGADVVTSQIEVRKTGEVLANGQRLR